MARGAAARAARQPKPGRASRPSTGKRADARAPRRLCPPRDRKSTHRGGGHDPTAQLLRASHAVQSAAAWRARRPRRARQIDVRRRSTGVGSAEASPATRNATVRDARRPWRPAALRAAPTPTPRRLVWPGRPRTCAMPLSGSRMSISRAHQVRPRRRAQRAVEHDDVQARRASARLPRRQTSRVSRARCAPRRARRPSSAARRRRTERRQPRVARRRGSPAAAAPRQVRAPGRRPPARSADSASGGRDSSQS